MEVAGEVVIHERYKAFLSYKTKKNLDDEPAYQKWIDKEVEEEDAETDDEQIPKKVQEKKTFCKFCKKLLLKSNISHHYNSCLGLQYFNYLRGKEQEGRSKCRDCGKIYLRKNEKQHQCDSSKTEKLVKCEYCGYNYVNHKKCAVKTIVDVAKSCAGMELSELMAKRTEISSPFDGQILKEKIQLSLLTNIELKEMAEIEKKTVVQLKWWFEKRRKRLLSRQNVEEYKKEINWIADVISELPEELREEDETENFTPISFKKLVKCAIAAGKPKHKKNYDPEKEIKYVKKTARKIEREDYEIKRIFQRNVDEHVNEMDDETRGEWLNYQEEFKKKTNHENYIYALKMAQHKIEKEQKFAAIMEKWRIQKEEMTQKPQDVEAKERLIEKLFKKTKNVEIRPYIDPKLKTLPQIEKDPLSALKKISPFHSKIVDALSKKRAPEEEMEKIIVADKYQRKITEKEKKMADYLIKREKLQEQYPSEALKYSLGIIDEEYEKKLKDLGDPSGDESTKIITAKIIPSFKPTQPKKIPVLSANENTIIKLKSFDKNDSWKEMLKIGKTQISYDVLKKSKI